MNRRLGVLLAFAALPMAVVGACGDDSEREPRSGPASPAGAPQLDAASSEPAPTVPPPVPRAVPTSQESDGRDGGKAQLALPAQNRIIVHTARMSLVVDDVALTVDSITDVASDLGGWVVSCRTGRPDIAGPSRFASRPHFWTKHSGGWSRWP